MLPDDWKDWPQCTGENLYVRLGLDPNKADSYTSKQIESAFKERKEWWMKKPRSNPMWAERIRLADGVLIEARTTLCDPVKKKYYDVKIKQKQKEEREKETKDFLDLILMPFIEKDKILTLEEEDNAIRLGRGFGLTESECKNIINDALAKFGVKRAASTTAVDAFEIFKEAVYAAILDGWLEPKEKRYLINETAKKFGILEDDAKKIIIKCLKEKGAKEGSPKKSDLPEELEGKNYYEIFGISEGATEKGIELAYQNLFNIWNSRASNPKYSPYVRAVKDFLLEAKNTLLDPAKRKNYDESLKEPEEEVELWTTPPGIPILELSENKFSFVDIDLGSSHSSNFVVKNGGGGALEATIKTTKPWLNISHAKIHQKDLPLAVTVTVDTSKDKKCNFGFRDIGYVEISYKKAGSIELVRIPVDLSIQTHRERARELTNRAVVISTIASGIAVFYVLATQHFSGWGIFGLIIGGIFGIVALNQIRTQNIGKSIGWLVATAFLLLLVKEVLFLVFMPIVITWLLSSVIFKRYPMKTGLSFIIPSAACGTCFIIASFSLSPVTFKKIGGPLISSIQQSRTAPKSIREEAIPSPERITEVKIKTEEEEFYEVLKNPDLKSYLNFIEKYPSNIRRDELKDRVVSANPNLPPEKYWLNIKENNKGYWEYRYKDFITLVWIPSGKLEINDENRGQQQEVYIESFWIGKYEVIVEQYKIYCYTNNLALPDSSYLDGEPMRNLNWFDANNFCKWMGCRLPTELEWERAAKGGKDYSNYPWGENFNPIFCNVNSNNIIKIGSLKENEFGLYDIIGNVEEWCENWYSNNILSAPENQLYKVLRGGSYLDVPQDANIARRNYIFPSYKKETYGFRVIMD